MTKHTTLPIDELRSLLGYDPETGLITRLATGSPALYTLRPNGYLWGHVSGKLILAHRAAWAISYGVWPVEVDHINRVRSDNRLSNLRSEGMTVQSLNQKRRRTLSPQFFGVGYLPSKDRWIARFKGQYLGCFLTAEAAAAAFDAKAIPAGVPPDLLNFGADREQLLQTDP